MDEIGNYDDINNEDNIKNEDDIINVDDIINDADMKNEDYIRNKDKIMKYDMIYEIYCMIYHIIFKCFTLKKCKKSINRSASMGQCQSLTKFVSFHTNFKFGGKLYLLGIPRGIPYLLTEPDFKISALFSSYSDIRYWNLYTDHTVYDLKSLNISGLDDFGTVFSKVQRWCKDLKMS